MNPAEVDLKTLVTQSRSLINDILDTSHKLVVEVEAAHYWTTYSLDIYSQLSNITANLLRLLELTQPRWEDGEEALTSPEGQKLWRTAVGLWRALPPVRNKFAEQLSRRRRQRIMGQEIEEVEELDPEAVEEEQARFRGHRGDLQAAMDRLGLVLELLPDGLAPPAEPAEQEPGRGADQEQAPAADAGGSAAPGHPDEPAGEESPARGDAAAGTPDQAESAPADSGAADSIAEPPASATEPEEISPV
jgi:hypothetical protein